MRNDIHHYHIDQTRFLRQNEHSRKTTTTLKMKRSKCGNKKICEINEYCCNASCSICAPKNGNCVHMICEGTNTKSKKRVMLPPLHRRSLQKHITSMSEHILVHTYIHTTRTKHDVPQYSG
jgi:hypothetical protein